MGFIRNLFKSKTQRLLEKYGWKFLHDGSSIGYDEKIYYNNDFPQYIIQYYFSVNKRWRLLESLTHLPPENKLLEDFWCTGDIDEEWLQLINDNLKKTENEIKFG